MCLLSLQQWYKYNKPTNSGIFVEPHRIIRNKTCEEMCLKFYNIFQWGMSFETRWDKDTVIGDEILMDTLSFIILRQVKEQWNKKRIDCNSFEWNNKKNWWLSAKNVME